ncbi:hypothetical protein E2P47_04410 [Candidatus Bathyarchaeota archaeon]|nr:hypothetical protein E2P47_04410 [Candidatus Bathyarchaeota archaeon]
MKQVNEGLDYTLYKIYIVCGIAFYVVWVFVQTLVFDALNLPGSLSFLVLGVPLMLWFAGVLLYWWWVFLFKENRELEEQIGVQKKRIPSIKSLKSWSTLHKAMAIYGGNIEEQRRNEMKARRPILVWYGFINLMVVWIFGPITLGSLGIYEMNLWVWLGGMFLWIIMMLALTYLLLGWGGKAAEKAYLAPLGLAITQMPELKPDEIIVDGQKLMPDGPAIIEGKRYGRLVHIETIGRYNLTVLEANLPEFRVRSEEGKLFPYRGAPEAVTKALKSLPKAKRWRGIKVNAGPEGIGVKRESKGTNMWLYDLWLAEYLLHKISAQN